MRCFPARRPHTRRRPGNRGAVGPMPPMITVAGSAPPSTGSGQALRLPAKGLRHLQTPFFTSLLASLPVIAGAARVPVRARGRPWATSSYGDETVEKASLITEMKLRAGVERVFPCNVTMPDCSTGKRLARLTIPRWSRSSGSMASRGPTDTPIPNAT